MRPPCDTLPPRTRSCLPDLRFVFPMTAGFNDTRIPGVNRQHTFAAWRRSAASSSFFLYFSITFSILESRSEAWRSLLPVKIYSTTSRICVLVNLILETRGFGGVTLQLIHSMRQVCHSSCLVFKL